jgi:hypothetical protein
MCVFKQEKEQQGQAPNPRMLFFPSTASEHVLDFSCFSEFVFFLGEGCGGGGGVYATGSMSTL